jgi:hypothetical protein
MTLVNRLRARTRTDLVSATLQRGAAIVELTAKHWFADTVDAQAGRLAVRKSDDAA